MTTPADLAALTANATSPIRDSRSPAGNRITTSSVTIDVVGSTFGAAPSISIYREGSNGTPGELLHVTGTATEMGDITATGGECRYQVAADGFTAIPAREGANSCTLQHVFADCTEFRVEKMEMIPNHSTYPMRNDDSNRGLLVALNTSSCHKTDWFMCDLDGSGVADKTDLCVDTSVSGSFRVTGNATQPGIGALVLLQDFVDFNAPYAKGHYVRFGAPDPNVDLGRIEADYTSSISGSSKTTGTKTINADVVLNAVGGVFVPIENSKFNTVKANAYIELNGGQYQVQVLRRSWYVATGANSYQCAYLTNSAVWADATWKTAVVPTAWSASQITVPISDYAKTMATHVIIRKPDGSKQAMEIPNG